MVVVFVLVAAAVAFYSGVSPVGHWHVCLADDLECPVVFSRAFAILQAERFRSHS